MARPHGQVIVERLEVGNPARRAAGGGRAAKASLNRALLDAWLGEFRRLLSYQARGYGYELVAGDPATGARPVGAWQRASDGRRWYWGVGPAGPGRTPLQCNHRQLDGREFPGHLIWSGYRALGAIRSEAGIGGSTMTAAVSRQREHVFRPKGARKTVWPSNSRCAATSTQTSLGRGGDGRPSFPSSARTGLDYSGQTPRFPAPRASQPSSPVRVSSQ